MHVDEQLPFVDEIADMDVGCNGEVLKDSEGIRDAVVDFVCGASLETVEDIGIAATHL